MGGEVAGERGTPVHRAWAGLVEPGAYKESAERPCFLSDRSNGSRGSSPPVQKARGERLKGDPQVGCLSQTKDARAGIHTRTPSRLKAHSG